MNELFQTAGLNLDWRFTLTFGALIMTRLLLVTLTIPFLTGKPAPAQIKMGLAVSLTIFLYPLLAPQASTQLPSSAGFLMILFLKEGFYGFLIGLAGAIVFYGFEAAGNVVDNQRGAAQARVLIPQLGTQGSLFGNFFIQFGIVIFLSIGGHLFFFEALIRSYQILPILELPQARPDYLAMVEQVIMMTGQVLTIAAAFAAPVMMSILLADIVLGITNRIAPQINVWEMGFSIRGYVAIVVVFLSLTILADQMEKRSLGMTTEVQKVIDLLAVSKPAS